MQRLPENERDTPVVKELSGYGCGTVMHIVELNAPRLDDEDHTRDIDFTPAGIHHRWQAGYQDTQRMLELKPWDVEVDPMVGVAVHDLESLPAS